jgi:hypothetical protein
MGHTNTCVALARMEKLAERFGVSFFRDKDSITGGIIPVHHEKEVSFAGLAPRCSQSLFIERFALLIVKCASYRSRAEEPLMVDCFQFRSGTCGVVAHPFSPGSGLRTFATS